MRRPLQSPGVRESVIIQFCHKMTTGCQSRRWRRRLDAGTGDASNFQTVERHAMPFEAVHLSPADEKRIARDLSPPVAWPTLALAVVLPTMFWGLAGLGFARVMALWLCVPALTFLSNAHYTLVHESIHDNLVPGHPKLRWINTLVGWV